MVSVIHVRFTAFLAIPAYIVIISLCTLVDEIQAACYKILDSAYLLNCLAATTSHRKSIAYEIDKYALF